MKLYDTLSKTEKEIKQLANGQKIRFYSCGPTVYNYAHIGNLRAYLFADSIYRALRFVDIPVDWVMNLTDVDDKTIRDTIKEHGQNASVADLRSLTTKYTDLFVEDIKSLNIEPANVRFFRVSDVIPQIQDMVLRLIDKGYAYQTDDGTYFSIEKYQQDFGDYGELVGKGFIEGKKVGARVKVDEYEKDNLSDFALWKKHGVDDAQIFWEHPVLGRGRPGWHIECSVINDIAFEHQSTDIHTGGVDLVFPHHTNEIAQSQPMYKPFVKHWAHGEHLQIDNKKMAKRDGNFFVLKDILEKASNPLAFRYLCLQTDFRKQMNFTWESLEGAKTALERLYKHAELLAKESKEIKGDNEDQGSNGDSYKQSFRDALEDNLNLPKALAVVWELLADNTVPATNQWTLLLEMDTVLGLGLGNHQSPTRVEIPEDIKKLAEKRDIARKNKNYDQSDELRKRIEQAGFEVLDTPQGTQIK